MKTYMINGKEYKIEFGFEAAYVGESVEKVIKLLTEGMNGDAKFLAGLTKTVVQLFHSGLQENNPVESENDAKELVKQYLRENKNASVYSMAEDMVTCMEDDGFLNLLGLTDEEQTENAIPMPQDHKKKQTAKKTAEVSDN